MAVDTSSGNLLGVGFMKKGKLRALVSKVPFVLLPFGLGLMYVATHEFGSSAVIKQDKKIYIVDRTGERWEVTQAMSLGFDPEGF